MLLLVCVEIAVLAFGSLSTIADKLNELDSAFTLMISHRLLKSC